MNWLFCSNFFNIKYCPLSLHTQLCLIEISCIQETLSLLMCVDSNTDKNKTPPKNKTKITIWIWKLKIQIQIQINLVLHSMCQVTSVTCHQSPVTMILPLEWFKKKVGPFSPFFLIFFKENFFKNLSNRASFFYIWISRSIHFI